MVDDGSGAETGEFPDLTAELDRLLAATGASRTTTSDDGIDLEGD